MKQFQYTYKSQNIFYYTGGNPKGETLVFLHPAFSDYTIFIEQLRYFEEEYNLVTIDMIGHGNSQIVDSKVNMGDMPDIINNILVENNITCAHLVGVSIGSLIAQGVANKYPSISKSVTIVGGYSIHKENKDILKAQRKEMFKWLFYIIFSMKKLRNFLVKVSVSSEYGKKVLKAGADRFTRKSFMGMRGMEHIFIDKPEPVPYPLLIVSGEYDLDLVKVVGIKLERLEPTSKYIEISEAGHCANIDNPKAFNEALKAFICQQ